MQISNRNQSTDANTVFNKEEGLKRTIDVWGLSANMINIVVGAGIFVLPAIVAAGLGSASVIAYLFCGFLFALIMLCFAEVDQAIPPAADGSQPGKYVINTYQPETQTKAALESSYRDRPPAT